jgi:hypothetical protein
MGRTTLIAAMALLASAGAVGCASDSSSTDSSTPDRTGVGQSAPISKVIVARRFKPPQQAALFGPVGRFFGRGFHRAIANGRVRVGVLVLPKDCAILRPEPGEARCFKKR